MIALRVVRHTRAGQAGECPEQPRPAARRRSRLARRHLPSELEDITTWARRGTVTDQEKATIESRTFDTREAATRFLALDMTYTYEQHEPRGLDIYKGPKFGERAALWPREDKWCVSFWKE